MIDQLTTKTVLRNVWGSRVTLSLQLTVGTCRSITTSCSGAGFVLWAEILISITFENTGLHSNDMTSPSWSIGGISSGRSAEIVKQEKFKKCDTTWGGVWTIISYSTSVLIAHLFFPPSPPPPFLWFLSSEPFTLPVTYPLKTFLQSSVVLSMCMENLLILT